MKKLIVMIASLVLVASFALTAAADDQWDFYGSARIATFVVDDPTTNPNEQFGLGLQGNARIGANVKVSDELSGRFEYGSGSATPPNLRLLYGTWNFGAGSLTVGQAYTPVDMFMSSQVFETDTGLLDTGGVYSGRQNLLQLAFGGFKFAAIPADANTDIPAFEASYSTKLGPASIKFAGAYDKDTAATDAAGNAVVEDAYVLAVSASMNFGAGYINANAYAGDYAEQVIWTAGEGENNSGFIVVVGFKVNDMLKLEAGYGSAEGDNADEYAYYLQAPITLANGVYVVPEIGSVDDGDTDYFGAKWQINF